MSVMLQKVPAYEVDCVSVPKLYSSREVTYGVGQKQYLLGHAAISEQLQIHEQLIISQYHEAYNHERSGLRLIPQCYHRNRSLSYLRSCPKLYLLLQKLGSCVYQKMTEIVAPYDLLPAMRQARP